MMSHRLCISVSLCEKRMYTLYNTARCVNTAWYINLGLNWVTNHIHMFPMSHKLSKSVNILQSYSTANLTDILRTQADHYDSFSMQSN
jgi:hypothetical protein